MSEMCVDVCDPSMPSVQKVGLVRWSNSARGGGESGVCMDKSKTRFNLFF